MRTYLIIVIVFLTSCISNNAKPIVKNDTAKNKTAPNNSISDSTPPLPAGLIGQWVKNLKNGNKRHIEISNTSDIFVYVIASNGRTSDTLKGKVVYKDYSFTPVEMHMPEFTFYYRWIQDTLIYYDEGGNGEKYVKRR